MGNRNQRFNMVFQTFVDDPIVKLETGFVRGDVIAVWKNTCSGNRKTIYFKSHISQKSDIFLIAMVIINA